MITERQKEYIKILSSFPSTREEDQRDIEEYLAKVGKKKISDLTVREASELIQILLRRSVEYTLPCGQKAVVSKQEANCYDALGKLEACLHSCQKNIDVNECKYWIKHSKDFEIES